MGAGLQSEGFGKQAVVPFRPAPIPSEAGAAGLLARGLLLLRRLRRR